MVFQRMIWYIGVRVECAGELRSLQSSSNTRKVGYDVSSVVSEGWDVPKTSVPMPDSTEDMLFRYVNERYGMELCHPG